MATVTNNNERLWEAWETYEGTDCLFCLKHFSTVHGRKIHEATCADLKQTQEQWKREAPKMHLTHEDVFAKGSQPAIQQSANAKRYLRKEGERFHRQCVRQAAAIKAKRALRHGWKPDADRRKTGEHQP